MNKNNVKNLIARFINDRTCKKSLMKRVITAIVLIVTLSGLYSNQNEYKKNTDNTANKNNINAVSVAEPVKVDKTDMMSLNSDELINYSTSERSIKKDPKVTIECGIVKPEDMLKDLNKIGYVSINELNIREKPKDDANIIGYLEWNEMVNYASFNDEWAIIEYNDNCAYINKEYISDYQFTYESKPVSGDSRKSYMDYTAITSTDSPQYLLQYNYAYTESNGVRAVNGRYCVALGSYYSHEVGQLVDLVLENGNVIPCVIGDNKQDIHTINNNSLGLDGGAAEFIVETGALSDQVQMMGDVSYASDDWLSSVIEIRVYDENVFD